MQKSLSKNKMKVIFLYLIIIIMSVSIFIPINPYFKYWFDTDGQGMYYDGLLLLDGKVPYVHFWDHKTPGVYFIFALAILLGNAQWGIWFFGLIALGVSALLGYKVLSKHYGAFPAIYATFLFFVAFLVSINRFELYKNKRRLNRHKKSHEVRK